MPFVTDPDIYRLHLNTEFVTLLEDGSSRSLRLTAIDVSIDDEIQRTFALHFKSPGPVLIQKLYRLSHSHLGEFDLFLVPIQLRKVGLVYEAVFNLLKD